MELARLGRGRPVLDREGAVLALLALCGRAGLPASIWWVGHGWAIVMLAAAILLVVFYAHREHLRRWLHPDVTAS